MLKIVCTLALMALASAHQVWVGILAAAGHQIPEQGGFVLTSGASKTVTCNNNWSGRFWGRTGCNEQGRGCETGECGGDGVHCKGTGGRPPATLAEITFDTTGNTMDFYDVSLVDGYNLEMTMEPTPGTFHKRGRGPYDCTAAGCSTDLNKSCPPELQLKGRDGHTVVACKSACEAFHTDAYCCRGAHKLVCRDRHQTCCLDSTPQTCPPFNYSKIFKAACPRAYSYAYDDKASTFTCAGNGVGASGYIIKFCTGSTGM